MARSDRYAETPEALTPYVITVRPNWVARISTAAVALLLLFFSVVQYQASQDAKSALAHESVSRDKADADRRIAVEALAQAREAQARAASDRAVALTQNGQLIEIALALEDQIARLGVKPDVPSNDVLRLRARTPIVQHPASAEPGAFVKAPHAAAYRPYSTPSAVFTRPRASATTRATRPTPRPTASPTTRAPILSTVLPTATLTTAPTTPPVTVSVPIVSTTACLPPLVCIR